METDLLRMGGSVLALADKHGAGLAALAALISVPILLWQIFQGARQERARARARRYAALASLPMTLSGINVWAKQVVRCLNDIYPWAIGAAGHVPQPRFNPPPSPDHLISAIEKMIEAAPGDDVGKTLAAIVADIQVLNSRIGEAAEFEGHRLRSQMGMIDSNMFLAARIYARAESLYDSCRALSEDAPIDYARVSAALSIMGIHEGELRAEPALYPTAHDMATKAHQRALERRCVFEKLRDSVLDR